VPVGNVGVLRAARAVFRPVLRAARAVFRPVLRAARAVFRPVLRAARAVFRPVLRAVLLAFRAVLRTVLRAFRAVFVAIVFLPFCFDVAICSFRVRFHRIPSPDFAVAHGKSSHNSSGSLATFTAMRRASSKVSSHSCDAVSVRGSREGAPLTDKDIDAKARATNARRFSPPWQVEQIPGGFKVLDASGQALATSTHERHASRPTSPRCAKSHSVNLVTGLESLMLKEWLERQAKEIPR
jgi:hypothetical protein